MSKAMFGQELLTLYEQLLQDIRGWKAQQWHVTASSISLHIVLAGVVSLVRSFSGGVGYEQKWMLGVLAWIVAGFGVAVIIMLHKSTWKARQKINLIRDVIPNGDDGSLRSFFAGNNPGSYSKFAYGISVPLLLAFHIILAASVLTWIIRLA